MPDMIQGAPGATRFTRLDGVFSILNWLKNDRKLSGGVIQPWELPNGAVLEKIEPRFDQAVKLEVDGYFWFRIYRIQIGEGQILIHQPWAIPNKSRPTMILTTGKVDPQVVLAIGAHYAEQLANGIYLKLI